MASTKQPKIPANTCPECGAPMVYETRPDTIEYGGEKRVFPMLAWWCTECDEGIFEGQPLADRERAFLELKAEVDEVLSPSQVAAVRTKLGLSQRKAGELLGGGPRSFYKYESGKQAVSVPMSHLLTLLDHDVSRLQELRGAAERVAKRAHRAARTVTFADSVESYPKATVSKNEPPRRSARRSRATQTKG